MKRKFVVFVATAVSASAMFLSSCSKTPDAVPSEDSELSVATSDSDDNNEVDGSVNDVMDKMSSDGTLLRTETDDCGGSLIKEGTTNKKYKITYNGTCNERAKSGEITVELTKGANFREAGAEWTVLYTNVTINNSKKNRKLVLNGTHTVTNVSGGNKNSLTTAGFSLIHKIVGSMTASINDTSTRTWSLNRTNTWTSTSLTVSADGEADGFKNLVRWGTNKAGNKFYTEITTPIVFTVACGKKPTAGVRVHTVLRPVLGDLVTTQTLGSNGSCGDNYSIEVKNKKTGKEQKKSSSVI